MKVYSSLFFALKIRHNFYLILATIGSGFLVLHKNTKYKYNIHRIKTSNEEIRK